MLIVAVPVGAASDWSIWINALSALLGALVGGAIAYWATLKGMRHDAELRQHERLRSVRGRMVEELTGPLTFAFEAGPMSTDARPFEPLRNVVRLSYSATPEDFRLSEHAEQRAAIFVEIAQVVSYLVVFNEKTGLSELPPDAEQEATDALEALRDALMKLDLHLRGALQEEAST